MNRGVKSALQFTLSKSFLQRDKDHKKLAFNKFFKNKY